MQTIFTFPLSDGHGYANGSYGLWHASYDDAGAMGFHGIPSFHGSSFHGNSVDVFGKLRVSLENV